MSVKVWLAFAVTELVLVLTPGPAVLFVVSSALRGGWGAGARASLGIVSGNAFYFGLSAVGLGALLATSVVFFQVVRWAGAVYLVYLGVAMLFRKRGLPGAEGEPRKRFFLRGLIVQLANPKALIFFVALLPQFVSARGGMMQFIILGVTSVVVELCVQSVYAWVVDRGKNVLGSRTVLIRGRLAGTAMVGAGVRLAMTRGT